MEAYRIVWSILPGVDLELSRSYGDVSVYYRVGGQVSISPRWCAGSEPYVRSVTWARANFGLAFTFGQA